MNDQNTNQENLNNYDLLVFDFVKLSVGLAFWHLICNYQKYINHQRR